MDGDGRSSSRKQRVAIYTDGQFKPLVPLPQWTAHWLSACMLHAAWMARVALSAGLPLPLKQRRSRPPAQDPRPR